MSWKKLVCVVVTMLMITSSTTILLNKNDIKVKAAEGGQQGPNNAIGLNYSYMWDAITYISNAAHKAYNNSEIHKGRAFGSKGCENYSKNYIYRQMIDNLSLDNVKIEKLGPLPDLHPLKYYTSWMNVIGYNLTIQNPDYATWPHIPPLPRSIPLSECFPVPSNVPPRRSHNFTINSTDNVRVIRQFSNGWPNTGTITEDHKNVLFTSINDCGPICGNVTLIDNSSELPVDQTNQVFLINETENSENILDNITADATGVILIHQNNPEYTLTDPTQYPFSIARVNGNNQNLTNMTDRLEHGQLIYVDNFDDVLLTFNYDLPCTVWPDYNFMLIAKVNTTTEHMYGKLEIFTNAVGVWLNRISKTLYNENKHHEYKCKGIIIYSEKPDGTHYQWANDNGWGNGVSHSPFPSLPIFSINNSVGLFLYSRSDHANNTISGYMNETYLQETHGQNPSAGVDAYDVSGHITIPKSPEDKIVLISNRVDSFYGECPGDSGIGTGVVLTLAKFFREHPSIIPKYNLTFLEDTGEEYGFRGAEYYSDNHSNDNIFLNIGFDQLGMNQVGPVLTFHYKKTTQYENIVQQIVKDSHYDERTKYGPSVHKKEKLDSLCNFIDYLRLKAYGDGTEDIIYAQRNVPCETIYINRDSTSNTYWNYHHQTGNDFTSGDSLSNTDRSDVNLTFEVIWNITKYFTVNPNCWFNGPITYTAGKSPNHIGSYNDTINATFTIKSILPSDEVRVKASLINWSTNQTTMWKNFDFEVTDQGTEKTITVILPPNSTGVKNGNYYLNLTLYNSTGRIDNILGNGMYNDSDTQTSHFSLHKRGNSPSNKPNDITGPSVVRVNESANYTTNTTDPNQDQLQYEWTWDSLLSGIDFVGPYNSGENCTQEHTYYEPGLKVIKTRTREDYSNLFDGPWYLNRYGDWSPWSDPLLIWTDSSASLEMSTTALSSMQIAASSTLLPSVRQINSIYNALILGGRPPYNCTWTFDINLYATHAQTARYNFSTTGRHTVTLNVTDKDGYTNEFTVNVSVVNLSVSFNISTPTPYAEPDENITFTNTSAVASGCHITNVTWDFNDSTKSYAQKPTHAFAVPGYYTVTLTVKDNQSHTDVASCLIQVLSDNIAPVIQTAPNEVNAYDHWVNTTILANADDFESGIHNVYVNITSPTGTHLNHTMTHYTDDIYWYMYNNTSQPGLYNYTIWATDYANNTANSTGHNFTIPTPPVIVYERPTPNNNSYTNQTWTKINTTILDLKNTSAFIDWDHALKAYWPMDTYNTTGVYDNSTYHNFGKFYNGVGNGNIVTGKYGKALDFDGNDDYLDCGNNQSLNLGTSNFTFMVWEKSEATTYPNVAIILSNRPNNANWKGYIFGVLSGSAQLYTTSGSGQVTNLVGNKDVTDNTWHHIAYVRRGTNLSLYIDGAYDAGTTGTIRNITNTLDTYFSYENRADWYHFDGILDEAQLYNRALNLEEIKASYNNGLYRLYHNFTGLADGTYQYYTHAIDTSGNQSKTETRNVTVDTVPPTITSVSASPNTVGFGYNVTINATVTDDRSGVNNVSVKIFHPAGRSKNPEAFLMSHLSGAMYQYIFTDTWYNGRYNYTITAYDNAGNMKNSTGHSFNVSSNATISVCTLKNSYTGTDYINLTDPPHNDEGWIPDTNTGVINNDGYQLNYPALWDHLLSRINYTLEENTVTGWHQTNGLTIHYRNITDDQKKYTIIFNATEGTPLADYRINCTIDSPLLNHHYDTMNKTLLLTYETNGHQYTLTYNYNDLPLGLDIQYDTTGGRFWFSITKNRVPNGLYSLDPYYQISAAGVTNATRSASNRLLVRDSTGKLHTVYMKTNGGYNNIFYANSTNNGSTWKEQQLTHFTKYHSTGGGICIDANDTIYIVYSSKQNNGTSHVNFTYSTNSGLTWSTPVNIGWSNYTIYDNGPSIAADSQGNLHVAWDGYSPGATSTINAFYRKRTGTTWDGTITRLTSVTGTLHQLSPSVAITPNNDVLVTWQGRHAGSASYYQIRVKHYWTSNSTWSKITNITSGTVSQYGPSIAIDQNSNILISWYAVLNSKNNIRFKEYWAGNNTWSKIRNLTTSGSADSLLCSIGIDSAANINIVYYTVVSSVNQIARLFYNTTAGSWTQTQLTTGAGSKTFPNMLYSLNPSSGGRYSNIPYRGYAFVFTNGTNAYYQYSSDLAWQTQSKIKNTGSTNIKGYLLIQIQFYNTGLSSWVVDNDTVNETSPRTITSGSQLGLDTVFNGHIRASDLTHGNGRYRIYAAFRDPDGNVLRTCAGVELKAYWEFNKT